LLLTTSASSTSATSITASATIYRCLLLPLILHHWIDRNSSEVLGGHSYSPGNSLGIPWICFSC
jgi:hypothetical protein